MDDAEYEEEEGFLEVEQHDRVSVMEYLTFILVGTSFLWPWNCYLSATAYFTTRLTGHPWLQSNFSSAVMATSTITSTVMSYILANKQKDVNYSKRLLNGELTIVVQFIIVAGLCAFDIPAVPYFVIILVTLFISTMGASLTQNGSFAICNILSPKHMVANTVGQAISGVIAALASLVSSSATKLTSALYFATGSIICLVAYVLYRVVMRHHSEANFSTKDNGEYNEIGREDENDNDEGNNETPIHVNADTTQHTRIPLRVLFRKLRVPASAAFITFAITLIFPIFASTVVSTSGIDATLFVPLVYLFWNVGDLSGRFACNHPLVIIKNERMLIAYSWLRLAFLPLFLLCNVKNNDGAIIRSDIIYLGIHYLFGFSNGQLLTSAMVSVPDYVSEEEKEPAGGCMTLALSLGLALGSILSFGLAWFLAGY